MSLLKMAARTNLNFIKSNNKSLHCTVWIKSATFMDYVSAFDNNRWKDNFVNCIEWKLVIVLERILKCLSILLPKSISKTSLVKYSSLNLWKRLYETPKCELDSALLALMLFQPFCEICSTFYSSTQSSNYFGKCTIVL